MILEIIGEKEKNVLIVLNKDLPTVSLKILMEVSAVQPVLLINNHTAHSEHSMRMGMGLVLVKSTLYFVNQMRLSKIQRHTCLITQRDSIKLFVLVPNNAITPTVNKLKWFKGKKLDLGSQV